ncbi:hypothetical protein HY745_09625 [Candidatus Desantisbacteria bacterium]|nr:hypothetical protein [Candidatus Desantisbacteria bacterium]
MNIPEYITIVETKRVCKELKISDWTKLKDPVKVSPKEASIILKEVNKEKMEVSLDQFCAGLEVELEHGTRFKDVNVTNNHPILTGKIVLAHMKESLDYYKYLEVAELEGDLNKAVKNKDLKKITDKYKKLIKAKLILNNAEMSNYSGE